MKTLDTESLLQRLIAYPTVSQNSNLELIDFCANYLEDCGATTQLVHDAERRKANLHARFGPEDIAGVALSGHSDVVPVTGQNWSVDPFNARIDDDRIYGRGSADMKGFLAAVMAAVATISDRQLQQPLHVMFSYDEEIGCIGVRRLIDEMKTWPVLPSRCVIGEPTSMQTAIAHKGKTVARCECHGVAAHSALPHLGVNAIYLALDLIDEIRALQGKLIHSTPANPYSVPYTTLQVGTIEGGLSVNIVPQHCRFDLEIRNLPEDDPGALLEHLNAASAELTEHHQQHFAEVGIDITVINQYPALDTAADHGLVNWIKSLCDNDQHTHLAFGTEGGLFQRDLGIATVVCGPGSMDQGHKPDEFIDRRQLADCKHFLDRLIDDISVN